MSVFFTDAYRNAHRSNNMEFVLKYLNKEKGKTVSITQMCEILRLLNMSDENMELHGTIL